MSLQTQLTSPFSFFPPAEVQAIKSLERENETMKDETKALKITITDLEKDIERLRGKFETQEDELSDLIFDTRRGLEFHPAGTPPPQNTVSVLNCPAVMCLQYS